jgi:uncharacterized membrane protein
MVRPTSSGAPAPRETATQGILALAFDSPLRAQEALLAVLGLEEEGLLVLHEAVFVTRHAHGPAHVTGSTDPTAAAAAVPSSLFGALVGTLVAGPLGFLIGGVVAGGTGALVSRLVATGIPHHVIAELRELTRPGQSVLAMLVGDLVRPVVLGELHRFAGAQLVHAELPPDALELVRRALHEPSEPRTPHEPQGPRDRTGREP